MSVNLDRTGENAWWDAFFFFFLARIPQKQCFVLFSGSQLEKISIGIWGWKMQDEIQDAGVTQAGAI